MWEPSTCHLFGGHRSLSQPTHKWNFEGKKNLKLALKVDERRYKSVKGEDRSLFSLLCLSQSFAKTSIFPQFVNFHQKICCLKNKCWERMKELFTVFPAELMTSIFFIINTNKRSFEINQFLNPQTKKQKLQQKQSWINQ